MNYQYMCVTVSLIIIEMLSTASEQKNIKDHFDLVGERLQSLQKLLSDSSLYLPRYNLRTSQHVSQHYTLNMFISLMTVHAHVHELGIVFI